MRFGAPRCALWIDLGCTQVKYDDGESLDHLLEAQHWKVKVVKHAPATA